jgi:hypothetical protein
MAIRRVLFFWPALFLVVSVLADAETLFFRPTADGSVVAVVSGFITDACAGQAVEPPDSVLIVGTTISINSIAVGHPGCVHPLDVPVPYEVVASLGRLPANVYTVSWTYSYCRECPRLILFTQTLALSAFAPAGVPVLPRPWLLTTALLLWLSAGCYLRNGQP